MKPLSLWFGLFGAAAAWAVEEITSYAVVAHACYPNSQPLMTPAAGGPAYGVATVVTLLTGLVALGALRVAAHALAHSESDRDSTHRYLAMGGVVLGVVFTLLIVFNVIALVLEPTCRY